MHLKKAGIGINKFMRGVGISLTGKMEQLACGMTKGKASQDHSLTSHVVWYTNSELKWTGKKKMDVAVMRRLQWMCGVTRKERSQMC